MIIMKSKFMCFSVFFEYTYVFLCMYTVILFVNIGT